MQTIDPIEICSSCRTVVDSFADRCQWCGASSPEHGWSSADGDPWLGREIEGFYVAQQLQPGDGIYRVESGDLHCFEAQFFVLNRLHTRIDWLQLVERVRRIASSRYFVQLMKGWELDEYGVLLYQPARGMPLRTWRERANAVDPALALELTRHVLCGLDPLHRNGMYHGAIGPSALVLALEREEIARIVTVGATVGLPSNSDTSSFRPEEPTQSPSDDVYAAGALLFWLVTGREPSRGVLGIDPGRLLRKHRVVARLVKRLTDPATRPLAATMALSLVEQAQREIGVRPERPDYRTPAPVESGEVLAADLHDPLSGEMFSFDEID